MTKKMMKLTTLLTMTAFMAMSTAIAADQKSKGEISKTTEQKKAAKKWRLSFSTSYSQNMYQFSDVNFGASTSFSTSVSYKLPKGWNMRTGVSMSKSLKGEKKSNFNDIPLSFSRSLGSFKGIGASLSLGGTIPVSKASQDYSYLRSRFSASTTFSASLAKLGLKGASVSLTPYGRYYWKRYETGTEYSIGSSLGLSYSYKGAFISLSGSYSTSTSFFGTKTNSFSLSQTIGYGFGNGISVSLGHSNGGSPLTPDQKSSNIKIYDDRTSGVYASVSYSL